jgi:two-component system, sporulation sensor kinase B
MICVSFLFLIGGIHGGRKVLLGLSITMIAVRIPFMGNGLIVTIILTILSSVAIYYLSPKLSEMTWRFRVYCLTLFSFCNSILGLLIPSIFFDVKDYLAFAIYSFVLTVSTFLVFYLCEMIRLTVILQLESMKYEKMQVVSHLAASISHEIRNPLTTVKGFLQLIN